MQSAVESENKKSFRIPVFISDNTTDAIAGPAIRQVRYRFENGYGASIISDWMPGQHDYYEVAVMKYVNDPEQNREIGVIDVNVLIPGGTDQGTWEEMMDILDQIEALPKHNSQSKQ